jgi:hypothetical protein
MLFVELILLLDGMLTLATNTEQAKINKKK